MGLRRIAAVCACAAVPVYGYLLIGPATCWTGKANGFSCLCDGL
eukprot:COSAG01_NODE_63523_length_279_cov_1.716667_1_plen_43_part_10